MNFAGVRHIDMQSPTVSIIIPLYNHEKYIEAALLSVVNQTYPHLEIIVIDDGSTDNSADCLRSITDSRIQYIYQENQGAHSAINRGVELATGEYVAILNSDDIYHHRRIETFIGYCERHDTIDAVFSYVQCVDDKEAYLHLIEGTKDNWKGEDSRMNFADSDDIFLQLLGGNFLCTTSNLFCRKSVFSELGTFSGLRYTHDYEFFLRLTFYKSAAIVDKPLLCYRIHGENTLKESQTKVFLEVGLVLTGVLTDYDLTKYFRQYGTEDFLVRLFHSIQFYQTEKFALLLLLARLKYDPENLLLQEIVENQEHRLRIEECKKLDEEREKNGAFAKLQENRDEDLKRLKNRERELELTVQTILRSKSYRLARALSLPIRWIKR